MKMRVLFTIAALVLVLCLRSGAATYDVSPAFVLDTRDANGTNTGESDTFTLDTRDANGTCVGESGTFALDTRAPSGQSGYGVSGTFPLDTRGALPVSLGFQQSGSGFGSREVGSITDRTYTLTNNGSTRIFGSISVSGPFSIVGDATYNLDPGQSKAFTIRFSPATTGTFTGYVTITGGGGYTTQISATAYANPAGTFGTITGRVVDSHTGNPINGVRVATENGALAATGNAAGSGPGWKLHDHRSGGGHLLPELRLSGACL